MIKKAATTASLCAAALVVVVSSGCVQAPTEKQSVVDTRPSLTFRAESGRAEDARIFVDNLEMGNVDEYLEGEGALRVLPGTHLVRIVAGKDVLLEEKLYLSDGVNRTLLVK